MVDLKFFTSFHERLNKREKMVFYLSASIVSLMLFDRLIIAPVFSQLKSLDDQIQEKITTTKKNLHILSQKNKIMAEGEKYKSFFNALEPGSEDMASFMNEIESHANKTSVYLIDLKPGNPKETGSGKKNLVYLTCEAQMEQLVNFIFSVENSDKFMTVEKFQISPKSKESSVARCVLTISQTKWQ
jgi:hypothetical protein